MTSLDEFDLEMTETSYLDFWERQLLARVPKGPVSDDDSRREMARQMLARDLQAGNVTAFPGGHLRVRPFVVDPTRDLVLE